MDFDWDYLIAFRKAYRFQVYLGHSPMRRLTAAFDMSETKKPLNSSESSGALRFIDMAVKEGVSSNSQWRGAIQERLPSLVHHQDNDLMLPRETNIEPGLRLIPSRN
ncbi:hypothetical protein [Pseudomonas syringae]|uniref:hypothetical protein n=1 Tax=Pseudomonas syringae TaxID=317 RepID=UPI0018E60032|nr:hypothetical protein [Pseudomonas syringae]MBI6797811.1 hypothetical protein [Pseudomonas syringae]